MGKDGSWGWISYLIVNLCITRPLEITWAIPEFDTVIIVVVYHKKFSQFLRNGSRVNLIWMHRRISDDDDLLYIRMSNGLVDTVVATTRRNGTHSMLTSAKLSVGYLVVGITRELDKKPSLYYPLYIYMAPGPCYNNIYLALKSMSLPHILLLIHMCFS